MTCQDNLSKHVIAIPIPNQTAEEVANKFVYEIILRYGIPNEILTDQGSQFMSAVFQNCCKLMKIKNIFASVYHPESNGALERSHKVLVEYLRCYVDKTKSDWDQWIQFACFTYNTTPHAVTKFTPYELLFGRKANIPGSLCKQPQPLYNMEDLVQNLKQKFQSAWTQARANLILGKEKRNDKINEKRKEVKYHIRDQVLIQNEQRKKLDPLWLGPYEVIAVNLPTITVRIGNRRKDLRIHVNKTKPYIAGGKHED